MLAPYKFPDLTPLGDVKPRTFTPDLDGLIAWLRTQDGETEYDYGDDTDCLAARFHRAIGKHYRCPFIRDYASRDPIVQIEIVAIDTPYTYAAALSRALSLRSESPVGGKVGES